MPLSRRRLHPALALLAATVCLALLWASGELAARRAGDDVRAAARHRLEVYSTSLNAVLEKYSYLPYTVAQNPDLQQLIAHPDDAQARARVNDYLARVNREAGALVLYAMGADGTTQGSSNWDTPESYVGMNFGFRPYVLDAMQGRTGGFYGVGVTTHVAGYFISAPVRDGQGRPIGVVAVKVSLAEMENSWRRASDRVLVVDRNGIAFLASEPEWRSHAITPLSRSARAYVEATRQYPGWAFQPLDWRERQLGGGAVRQVRLDSQSPYVDYLVDERGVSAQGWRLMLFADATPILLASRAARLGTFLLLLTLAAIGLVLQQRQRRIRERLAAQNALAQAHRELENKVEARTADLRAANQALAQEVSQRARTERELREAQSELVQAAKMAVLGQMAAGVTHELNQPLAAMRALMDNLQALLAAGRPEQALENVQLVTQLVDRMGRITLQLRNFSRKSPGDAEPVALRSALDDALLLLEQRQRSQRVAVQLEVPAQAWVMFEAVRLQQVLVNLLRNALDALQGQASPGRITVTAQAQGEHWALSIRDNGPGLSPEARAHLFDPFFTTKAASSGLGLGLSISLAIARDYGASLSEDTEGATDGGACFTLRMTRCDPPPSHHG
jgi:two-component system C4-dicarboxylate transport sensor histidine kinase DctB